MGRRARLAGALTLAVLLAGSAVPLLVAFARAEPPPAYSPPEVEATEPSLPEGLPACPAGGLAAYEGTEDSAGEARRLRNELAEVCSAIMARQVQELHRLWWVVAELVEASAQRKVTNEKLTAANESLRSIATELNGETALKVSDHEAVAAGGEVSEHIDATGEALGAAIWFVAGAVVAGIIGYGLYRQVMPRA